MPKTPRQGGISIEDPRLVEVEIRQTNSRAALFSRFELSGNSPIPRKPGDTLRNISDTELCQSRSAEACAGCRVGSP